MANRRNVIDDYVSGDINCFCLHNDSNGGLDPAAVIDNVHLFELTCEPASSIDIEWTENKATFFVCEHRKRQ